MGIRDMFGRKEEEFPEEMEEGYMEVNVMESEESKMKGKLGIRIERLSEFADTDKVLRHIRGGNIIFLKIKELREKDMGELKRAVEKLKRTITATNGDIAGVESDWLILAPEYAAVERT